MSDDTQSPNGLRALASAIISRLNLSAYLGQQFGGKRQLYDVFGYPKTLTVQQLLAKYERQDIASRIVSMPAGATWNNFPTMVGDTALVDTWNAITKKHKLWNILLRADKLSAMGRYSIVLIGFDDTSKMDVPLTPREGGRNILYMKPLSEASAEIKSFEDDPKSPRYGMPKIYSVKMANQFTDSLGGQNQARGLTSIDVHYSRIHHIVQDPLEDTIFGVPVMERIYNLLEDLLKVAGGAAETYWLASRRGLQADIDKDMELDTDDAEQLSDMLNEYQHDLRRIIRTRGVKLNDMGADVADPRGTFEVVTALISGATGIPQRILVGSEAGQLASEQDRANWADRIEERRTEFGEPIVLDPLVERFQQVGILPEGDFKWEWPDAFRLSPLERAQTMAQKARAVTNLVKQFDGKHVPMTTVQESRDIIGLEDNFDPAKVPLSPIGNNTGDNDAASSDSTRSNTPSAEDMQEDIEEAASDQGAQR